MSLPIQTSDPQTRLVKRYATVGRMDLRIDETVVPVVILDDVRETGEARAGVARGFLRQDAVATTLPTIEFRLPEAPSGVVVQTSRMAIGHDGPGGGTENQDVDIWVAQPNGTLPVGVASNRNWRDQGNVGLQIGSFPAGGVGERKPSIVVGQDLVSLVNLATFGPPDYTIVIAGTRQQTYPLEVTIIPGGSIFVAGVNFADGTGLFVSLDFVEQPRRA